MYNPNTSDHVANKDVSDSPIYLFPRRFTTLDTDTRNINTYFRFINDMCVLKTTHITNQCGLFYPSPTTITQKL